MRIILKSKWNLERRPFSIYAHKLLCEIYAQALRIYNYPTRSSRLGNIKFQARNIFLTELVNWTNIGIDESTHLAVGVYEWFMHIPDFDDATRRVYSKHIQSTSNCFVCSSFRSWTFPYILAKTNFAIAYSAYLLWRPTERPLKCFVDVSTNAAYLYLHPANKTHTCRLSIPL